jgi:hypothetical protein
MVDFSYRDEARRWLGRMESERQREVAVAMAARAAPRSPTRPAPNISISAAFGTRRSTTYLLR